MNPVVRTGAAAILLVASPFGSDLTACGYHDPVQINRGVLNWIYPDSLRVGTAIWEAQLDKRLPESASSSNGRSMLGYHNAVRLMVDLGERLDQAAGVERPSFVVLLLQPMMWTRFVVDAHGRVRVVPHVAGPSAGETVIVTDEQVVQGLLSGQVSPADAKRIGLYRIYSRDHAHRSLEDWLGRFSPDRGHANAARLQ